MLSGGEGAGGVVVYTIGTSLRSWEEFLSLLRKFGVELVIDVRRFPTSRLEHFKKEELSRSLGEANIAYEHIPELGGYRTKGYAAYTKTPEFRRGFRRLLELIALKRAAVMCCEKLYFRCHRRFIADELLAAGWEVVHIVDERRSQRHTFRQERLREDSEVGAGADQPHRR